MYLLKQILRSTP